MKKKLICLVMAAMALVPVSVSASTIVKGDVDANGAVNQRDLDLLRKVVLNEATAVSTYAADVDGNGVINLADLATLQENLSK